MKRRGHFFHDHPGWVDAAGAIITALLVLWVLLSMFGSLPYARVPIWML